MSRFYTPTEFKAIFELEAANVSSSDFIRSPKYKHLKEMWCALQFGMGYEKYAEGNGVRSLQPVEKLSICKTIYKIVPLRELSSPDILIQRRNNGVRS